jgi:hypothetical protein
MKPVLHTLLIALCLQVRAQNGLTVNGNVLDDRRQALPGATVFLGGTRYITASDTAGYFMLTNLKAGAYKVIVKVVGFKPLVRDIVLRDKDVQVNLQLEPDTKYLKSVTVRPDKSWLDNLQLFRKQFLGETENADQCKFVNPGVLNFTYDKKTGDLSAEADEMLVIRNLQLGYQVSYVLTRFRYNNERGSVVYEGFPTFRELRGTPEEEAQWKANRRAAFLGSVHHFIRSIYDQNSKAEGFAVYKIRNRAPFGFPNPNKHSPKLDYKPVSFDSLLTVVDTGRKLLSFSDELYVVYTKEKEPIGYTIGQHSLAGLYGNGSMSKGQVSIVTGFAPVMIFENGTFQPTAGLYFEGYMGWEKVGDLMPLDYDPLVD